MGGHDVTTQMASAQAGMQQSMANRTPDQRKQMGAMTESLGAVTARHDGRLSGGVFIKVVSRLWVERDDSEILKAVIPADGAECLFRKSRRSA